jgi:coatomer protein complex subunit epsilon
LPLLFHFAALLSQVGLHLGKSTSRYASQLKVVAPQHPMVLRAAAGEEAFDRAAAAVA